MARFDRLTIYNIILEDGMVPLFYHGDIEVAQQVTAALVNGGSRVLEFTNRGDYAIEVFSALNKHCAANHPAMIVGVGSVEDAPTAALYIAHGANFIVGPTFNEEVARLCNRRKIPYMPGCGTLNDVALAEEFGAEIVKAFPAMAVGGPGFVKVIKGPRPWTRIMPTGGVRTDEENLRGWFSAGVACVGMGSALVKKDWVANGDYASIETLTRETLQLIKRIRA
ncbi:MAG: bifunctional 4-hydroxy-2-oxoglutarate aldolase/2-dehydro-3-deoxy-phosphogluconate aldolase [Chloroflexota bacterium]